MHVLQSLRFTLPVILTLAAAFVAPNQAATLPSTEDSSSNRGKLTLAANEAAILPVNATRRAFIYFDLSDLPSGARIRYARLRLYLPKVTRAGNGLAVHRVTGSWDEELAGLEPEFSDAVSGTFAPETIGTKRFISVDVSEIVQGWLNDPASNEGFAVATAPTADASRAANLTIGAKEGSGSGYPAELEVELMAASLEDGVVHTGNIADGAVGSAQLGGNLTLAGTTSGAFSGTFQGSGMGSFAGGFTGNGSGLTEINSESLTGLFSMVQTGRTVPLGKIGSGEITIDVEVAGGKAYSIDNTIGLGIYGLDDPRRPQLLGSVRFPGGSALEVQGSYAYVAGNSLHIYDVSNPAAPQLKGLVPIVDGYLWDPLGLAVDGNRAYVTTSSKLKVCDISDPVAPTVLGELATVGGSDIVVAGSFAFISGNGGLVIVDVTNPAAPVKIGDLSLGTPLRIERSNKTVFVATYSGIVHSIDVTDPTAPKKIGQFGDGTTVYGMHAAGNLLYVSNSDRGIGIFDITNPANPVALGYTSILYGGLDVVVAGNYAYLGGYLGLHVIAISSLQAPSFSGDGALLTNLSAANLKGKVTSAQIEDGAIDTNHLAAQAVTGDKLASNSILSTHIPKQTIESDHLRDDIYIHRLSVDTIRADGSEIWNLNPQAVAQAHAAGTFMPTVLVGKPGNAADTNGIGAVADWFRMGKYEVTNAQYAQFLNSVATTDPNGLFDPLMATDPRGGIDRIGSSGSYQFLPRKAMEDKPANFVNWFQAIRFVNWLHNGMPRGLQESTTTEGGAYAISGTAPNWIVGQRSLEARAWLPSEHEWHKAAYFDPVTGGYWAYPTRSNDVPTLPQWTGAGSLRDPGLNVANYDNAVGWNGQVGNLTTVGSAGSGSETAWGAADMGGNAYEWVESIVTGSMRGLRGGGWNDPASMLHKMHRGSNAPTNKYSTVGFRVAMRQVW